MSDLFMMGIASSKPKDPRIGWVIPHHCGSTGSPRSWLVDNAIVLVHLHCEALTFQKCTNSIAWQLAILRPTSNGAPRQLATIPTFSFYASEFLGFVSFGVWGLGNVRTISLRNVVCIYRYWVHGP